MHTLNALKDIDLQNQFGSLAADAQPVSPSFVAYVEKFNETFFTDGVKKLLAESKAEEVYDLFTFHLGQCTLRKEMYGPRPSAFQFGLMNRSLNICTWILNVAEGELKAARLLCYEDLRDMRFASEHVFLASSGVHAVCFTRTPRASGPLKSILLYMVRTFANCAMRLYVWLNHK